MKNFELLDDLTSDVMFRVYGKTEKELFENSAKALFSVITNDISKIKSNKKIKVNIKGENLKELLFNWLNELIALVDIEEMFFSKFDILKITKKELIAEIYGDSISEKNAGTLVKATTYYGFDLKEKNKKTENDNKNKKIQNNNYFTATISFDV